MNDQEKREMSMEEPRDAAKDPQLDMRKNGLDPIEGYSSETLFALLDG
jgi:hypothetical protein